MVGPVYVIDEPFNPYRRSKAVLNRILLYEFSRSLALAENGTFNADDWDSYSGVDGLTYRKLAFQFGYVAPHVDQSLRDLWFEGVCKLPNRWAFSRESCENQTSHFMLDLYLLYMGSGQEVYKTVAHDFAVAFYDPELNSFMKTGYQQEAYGPDATYAGLCAGQQAIYYKFSRDEIAKEGLRQTYDLFNHTVAPEPDGSVLGASNFSHRTPGSWVHMQHDGGTHLMADELPEAALWHPELAQAAEYAAKQRERIETGLKTHWDDAWYEQNMRWLDNYAYNSWLAFFHDYVFPCRAYQKGAWPVLQRDRFDRNVNDEFFFIRRPGYYAAVYSGKTCHDWVKPQRKPTPFKEGWKMVNGVLAPTTAEGETSIWYPTQGLSMFWTPQYGNCLLGMNWNAYTLQLTRADLGDGKVSWPDYWSFSHEYAAPLNTLTMTSQMIDLPISVTRRMSFLEDGLKQDLALVVERDVTVGRLVEQIPYVRKEGMTVRFRIGGKWGPQPGEGCTAIRFANAAGAGVEVRFSAPARVTEGVPSRHYGQEMGLIEVDLGNRFPKGARVQLSYTMRASSAASRNRESN